MQNNKKTINVIHYTRIPTAATKVQGKKIMSFFRTDNAWYNIQDTICDIYLGKVFSERHDLFVKGKQSRERTKMMWLPERWSECDDNVIMVNYCI